MSFSSGWRVEGYAVGLTTRRCPPGIMASDITWVCLGPCSAILVFGRPRVAGARLGTRVLSSPVGPAIWEVSSALRDGRRHGQVRGTPCRDVDMSDASVGLTVVI